MIVLPMAGLSSRFYAAGYTVPKYMLDLNGRSVFSHALGSFSAFFGIEPILIICRGILDTPAFVRRECTRLGLDDDALKIVVLDHETGGQAETVAEGLTRAGMSIQIPLTIFNIDTFRPGFQYPSNFDVAEIDGYLEVFEGEGTHWSFVRPNPNNPEDHRVLEVAEKVRISNLCSTGLYYFRTCQMFQDLYAATADFDPKDLQGGERYIAPLYDIALKMGYDIRYSKIHREEVCFCGTPREYEELKTGIVGS